MEQPVIMVVDDEARMRKLIRGFLERDGYEVMEAADGTEALTRLKKAKPHLLIVDVMMPFMDGFALAKAIREQSSVPLIFLSAKGEKWDKAHGLKIGGDDYIVKPFMPEELLARVSSVLRRTYNQKEEQNILKAGPLTINQSSYSVKLAGDSLSLTPKEFSLLKLLVEHQGRVYSRDELLELIWGDSERSSERTVDTHIKTLRIKLGKYGKMIQTVWGVGYKLEV